MKGKRKRMNELKGIIIATRVCTNDCEIKFKIRFSVVTQTSSEAV